MRPAIRSESADRCALLDDARLLGAVPAGAGRRAASFALDLLLGLLLLSPAITGGVLLLVNGASWSPWPLWLILIGVGLVVVYQLATVITHGVRGVTAGKAALGLRSISPTTLEQPGFWRIALRSVVLLAGTAVPIVAILLLVPGLGDPRRAGRSLLDRVGGCWCLDIRAGLNPLDRAALLAARRDRDVAAVSTAEALLPLGTWAAAGAPYRAADRSRAGVVGFAGALAGWESGGSGTGA